MAYPAQSFQNVPHMKPNNYWIVAAFFLLTFYTTGGGTVESFVNYPTWLLIGEAECKAYHQALGPRIVLTLVIPLLLSTVFNVLLFWFRPVTIPTWTVWATLLLVVFTWVSTAIIQIPIQAQLSESGFSGEAIERLIATDLPLRIVPGYLRLVLSFWMLMRVVQNVQPPGTAGQR